MCESFYSVRVCFGKYALTEDCMVCFKLTILSSVMYQICSVYKVLGLLFNTSESSHLFLKCESVFRTYHIKVST